MIYTCIYIHKSTVLLGLSELNSTGNSMAHLFRSQTAIVSTIGKSNLKVLIPFWAPVSDSDSDSVFYFFFLYNVLCVRSRVCVWVVCSQLSCAWHMSTHSPKTLLPLFPIHFPHPLKLQHAALSQAVCLKWVCLKTRERGILSLWQGAQQLLSGLRDLRISELLNFWISRFPHFSSFFFF